MFDNERIAIANMQSVTTKLHTKKRERKVRKLPFLWTYLKERSRRSPRDGASSAGIGRSPSVLCWGSRQYGAHERGQQRAAVQRTRSLSPGYLSVQLKASTHPKGSIHQKILERDQ
ncbi:hypothetical protein TNCV_2029411 [Trichonephila clavipes]|nr:hypothetical protein TNCV_2029411 [Trichonephila clavipes]